MHDRPRQLVSLLLAMLCASMPAATALGLAMLGVGNGLAWGADCVFGIALGIVWYRWDRYPIPLIVMPISSALLPLLVVAFAALPARVLSGSLPTVKLEAAVARSSESVVAIEEARVEAELTGRYEANTDRTGGLATEYFAAPLTPAHQPRSKPAAAWVICAGDRAGCADAFSTSPLVGVLRAPIASDDVVGGGAIDDAIAKHSLKKPDRLVVLSIDSNPELEAAVPIVALGLGMLVFNALVLLVTVARARLRKPA